MKITKWILLLCLAMGVIGASAEGAASAGGVGDGGGNVLEESTTGSEIVREWLKQAKEPTRYALHLLEMSLRNLGDPKITDNKAVMTPYYAHLAKMLFDGPKSVYQVLDESTFAPIATGGCEGVNTPLEKDANSMKNPPSICFSLQNLSNKLREFFGKPQLIALIVHELSHRVGANEEEANMLQMLVQSQVSTSAFDMAGQVGRSFKRNVSDLIEAVSLSAADPASGLCAPLGTDLAASSAIINSVSDGLPALGIMVPTPRSLGTLFAVQVKLVNLLYTCYPATPDHLLDPKIMKLFRGKSYVMLGEYADVLGFSMVNSADRSLIVRRVDITLEDAVHKEMADVIRLLKTIRQ